MNNTSPQQAVLALSHHLAMAQAAVKQGIRSRLVDDRGEGVISMAIAILVIAALGAAMYAVFLRVGDAAGDQAEDSISNIGS